MTGSSSLMVLLLAAAWWAALALLLVETSHALLVAPPHLTIERRASTQRQEWPLSKSSNPPFAKPTATTAVLDHGDNVGKSVIVHTSARRTELTTSGAAAAVEEREQQPDAPRRPWKYVALSPARRQAAIQRMEQQLDVETTLDVNSTTTSDFANVVVPTLLDALSEWAKLGEGERAQALCDHLVDTLDAAALVSAEDEEEQRQQPRKDAAAAAADIVGIKDEAHRRVLHAWCNQLMRAKVNHPTRSTSSQGRFHNRNRRDGRNHHQQQQQQHNHQQRQERQRQRRRALAQTHQLVAHHAQEALMKLTRPLDDDYRAVLQAHARLYNVEDALHTFQQWQQQERQQQREEQERGHATTTTLASSSSSCASTSTASAAMTASLIRCILSSEVMNGGRQRQQQQQQQQKQQQSTIRYKYQNQPFLSSVEMAHVLLQQYHKDNIIIIHNKKTTTATTTNSLLSSGVYNRVLDAWSKELPTPSFSKKRNNAIHPQQQEQCQQYGHLQSSEGKDENTSNILRRASWIWNAIPVRTAKSHVVMIYTYCKCGKVQEAFLVWQQLLRQLLQHSSNNNNSDRSTIHGTPSTNQAQQRQKQQRERVDARSFRMLIHALSSSASSSSSSSSHKDHRNEQISDVLQGMWKLHEAGYEDTAPDVYLYTTAMNAQCQNVTRVRELVQELETRYHQYGYKNVQPDTAVYNALIHAIASQQNVEMAAEEAGSVVKQMERNHVEPDTITYNTVMDACLASNSKRGRERAEQTLLWMVEAFRKGNSRVKPTLKSFSSVIVAWADANSPARAEALLDVMEERYRPPASLFEAVISSWCQQAQVGAGDSSKRALRLLLRMEELFEATGNEALRPSMSLYNEVIFVSNDAVNLDDVTHVRERRDRMYPPFDSTLEPRRLSTSGEVFDLLQYIDASPLPPGTAASTRSFNAVISQLAKSGKVWAGQRAEDVLNYMLDEHLKKGNQNIVPNTVTFNSVMSAHARSSHPNASEKAAAVLEKLTALSNAGVLKHIRADRISYNTVMHAYAKSTDPMSGSIAEGLFHELESLYEESKQVALKPDVVTYCTLLSALANSGEPDSAKRAEGILLRMLKEYKADRNNVKPNTRCFNQVIYAWAKSQDEDASHRAEMVLRLMQDMFATGDEAVQPNTRTYNVVLFALANSKDDDAPIRAELILDQMRNSNGEVSKPDVVSYTTTISAWANQGRLGGRLGSINATIMLLEDLYESDIEVTPSFFSNLIHSLTRTGADDAPVAAEIIIMDLIKRIESGAVEVKLNTDIYNALINCWAKSGNRGAAARAVEILHEMEDEYAEGNTNVRPNVQTYTSVIDAYAKSREADAANRAENILNRMDDDGTVRPNAHTYTAVIQTYARSDSPSKATHAQAILNRMKDDYAGGNEEACPSVITYNAVLNACEFSVGETAEMEEAFRVACETLEEIRASDYAAPDDITYGTFLGVIAKLMPKSDTRNEFVELVFKRCCADGQLGPVTLKKLNDAASVYRCKRLLGGAVDNVPSKWTRNVVINR